MPKEKTCTVQFHVKEPDTINFIIDELKLDEKTRDRFFEFCEYAIIELEFDRNLKVVSGCIIPVK
jgi:hypothetical protein